MNFYATIDAASDEVQELCDPCSLLYIMCNHGSALVPVNPLYDRCCDVCGEQRNGTHFGRFQQASS